MALAPFRRDATNLRVEAYNDVITSLVQQRLATGQHLMVVDMYAALMADPSYRTTLLNDNLHPTLAGYVVMGQTWYAAIRALLPPAP